MKRIHSPLLAIASIVLGSSVEAATRVRTGAFTLVAGQAVRAHIVNTSGQPLLVNARFPGMDEEDFPVNSVDSEEADSFYSDRLLAGPTSTVHVEFTVEGVTTADRNLSFIVTVEVVDAATGQTRYMIDTLPPPDDGKQ